MRRPRTTAPERRRGDLLDAAMRIVENKGVAALTVDEVTAGAQVAKGTFYLYFRSKEQLLDALRERFVVELTARQAAELGELPADDWLGRLLRWMESGLRGYLANARLHDALFLHPSPGIPADVHGNAADSAANAHAAQLRELLEAGTAAGAFRLASPHATAVLLYNAMHGSADYLVHVASDTDLVEAVIAESLRLCRACVA
ncbi:TetR/AcrR family transcriptional regulator [Streptomyces sp. 6N223]|uniref:TetR/AcrR family transcriptional regulator n=1 Tax=Streptomyces sp. 6N223 TaxID=3457412 RepID=UPI003FD4C6E8